MPEERTLVRGGQTFQHLRREQRAKVPGARDADVSGLRFWCFWPDLNACEDGIAGIHPLAGLIYIAQDLEPSFVISQNIV